MFKSSLKCVVLAIGLLAGMNATASHLIGGNLGYTYIGETAPGSQIYRYQLYIQLYMNCGTDSNWPGFGSLLATNGGVLPVGVYIQDPLAPNADKQEFASANLVLVDSSFINPDLPSGCGVGAGLCTKLGLLTGTVDLPLNFGGYHLYFQMNARNGSISNLFDPGMTGIGFYSFIPPPLVVNSSPVWLGDPTPLLCINDTSTFVNSATDPDGDQLIFSFQTPYNSVEGGGGIINPPFVLPNTIPTVTYEAGYSVAVPFGAGGYAFINGATGLTRYRPTVQGNYVVAVEVREFRNGVLIGITRRDLQLQAVVCPPNDAPAVAGVLPTAYSVQAGDQLCFDLGFQDPNADSLLLTASGTIFEGTIFNPPATIIAPVEGDGTVNSTFCWDTDCAQAQDQPYLFSVSVTDNGCPPRTLDLIFQVEVIGFAGPTVITGPDQVCTGSTAITYSTAAINGAAFAWSVVGGSIMSGQGTNSISVDWGTTGSGSVEVSATNALGCISTPVILPVSIVNLPVADAGPDVAVCAGTSAQLGGSPTGPAGSTFNWTPAAALDNAGAANPTSTPTVNATYIVQVSLSGCVNTDTVAVTVSDPQVDAGTDESVCSGGDVQLNATGTGTFSWTPSTGLSASNVADPIAAPTITTDYIVTLTNGANCSDSDTVQVVVNELPVVSAGPDQTPCLNTTIDLGGSPTGPVGSTVAWTPATGLNSATDANPTLTVTGDATYIVVVTDANSCVTSDTMQVTVLPLPDVDAGPDLSVCAGSSIQLQGSGAGSLLWTPDFGLSDPTLPDPICQPEITTIYTLTVTGSNTCTNSDQTTVTVNVLPSADAGPDRTICAGDDVVIGTDGAGDFTWSPSAGLSATDVAVPTASPSITTTYTVVLADPQTCTAQDEVTVFVNTPAQAGSDNSASVCSDGVAVDLTTLLGGNADAGGTWIPGSTHVPGTGTQVYNYVVNGIAPCPNDTAYISITENVATNAGIDASSNICAGSDPFDLLTLLGPTADATGTWTDPNNAPFSGTFDPATSQTGTYIYVVAGAGSCTNDTAEVVIDIVPTADAGTSGSTTVCSSGASFDLFALLGGSPDIDGLWLDPTLTTHGAQFDPATDAPGTYTYIAGASTTCPDSAEVQVALSTPDIQFTGDGTICIGDTTQITGIGGTAFVWTPDTEISDATVADPLFYPSLTTTYTLTVTDDNGCVGSAPTTITVFTLPTVDAGDDVAVCTGLSVQVGGSPTSPTGTVFLWTPSTDLDDATMANPTASPGTTVQYTVTVRDDNQCANMDSVLVTVNAAPALEAGPDEALCIGNSVPLNATGTGTFNWSPATGLSDPSVANPIASTTTTTTYTVTLTDDNACVATDLLTVTVNGLPTADAGPDNWLCEGFGIGLSGSGAGSFSWSPAGSLNDATSATPIATPPSTTTYTLTVTDGNGCSATDQAIVTVGLNPPIDIGSNATTCIGAPVSLGGSPTSVPFSTYSWSPTTGLDDPSSPNPTALPNGTTTYVLTVTNETCVSTDQVTVTISGNGAAAFTSRFEAGCEEIRGFFTDESTGAVSWQWDLGNGGTSDEQNPQVLLPYTTQTVVSLVITDSGGCTDTLTQVFTLDSLADLSDISVPNVFTPNGDGKNDLFTLDIDAFLGPCTGMEVLNRWGQVVFESLGNNITWDGTTLAGEACVAGTYFYVIKVKDMSFKGTVLLTR